MILRIFCVFLMLFFLVTNGHSSVAISGSQPMITMSGVSMPLGQAVVLSGASDTTSVYSSLKRNNAFYQVPASKTLTCVAARATTSASGTVYFYVGYGDTTSTSATAPTNNVLFAAGEGNLFIHAEPAGAESADRGIPFFIQIPAGKYPYIYATAAGMSIVSLLCYLQ